MTDKSKPMSKIIQSLEIVNNQGAEYHNFFMYGHQTMQKLREGWYVKHIHDDPGRQIAWVLYEKVLDEKTWTRWNG